MNRYLIKKHCTPLPAKGDDAPHGCEHDHYYGKGSVLISTQALPTEDEILQFGFEDHNEALAVARALRANCDEECGSKYWSVQYVVVSVEAEPMW